MKLLPFVLSMLAIAAIVFIIQEDKRRQLDRLYTGQPEKRREAEQIHVARMKRVNRFIVLPIALTIIIGSMVATLFFGRPS